MPTDDYGNEIKDGDRLSIVVGIPGREVIGTVRAKLGRLVFENDEGNMPLSEVLKWYNSEVIR